MKLDKSTFLLLTGALAALAAGCERHSDRGDPGPAPRAEAPLASAAPAAPAPSSSQQIAGEKALRANEEADRVRAACNDDVGTVEECPAAIGPTDEGLCAGGNHAASRRCADFKTAFKPRVAQSAVACLRGLKGAAACDPNRANLCGHQALMLACEEGPLPIGREPGAKPGARTEEAPSTLTTQCDAIVASGAATPPGVSFADCHRTLSGMTASGRANMVLCMKDHAGDKGLYGCEATAPTPPVGGG